MLVIPDKFGHTGEKGDGFYQETDKVIFIFSSTSPLCGHAFTVYTYLDAMENPMKELIVYMLIADILRVYLWKNVKSRS